MKVLVACEYSGTVRDAFIARGHDAISCDLLPAESPGPHYQGDVFDIINDGFDMMIAHPPCTHLAVSGAMYFHKKKKEQAEALRFVERLMGADIAKIAVENPISVISTHIRRPDQIVNPFDFGVPERKKTCLWLKGLPLLKSTNTVTVTPKGSCIRKTGKKAGQVYNYYWRQGKSGHNRSKTFTCIAKAMAEQWGLPDQTKGEGL